MTRALATYATGDEFQDLLDIALPSFYEFADRHGYQVETPDVGCDRPASWAKVPILHALLNMYDEVLWIDADVVIVDPTEDLDVPADSWQALVEHHTDDGDVPNCGVWYVRKPMRPWLERVWLYPPNLPWWEQTALMMLMGYRTDPRPATLVRPTELYQRTHWLDGGFNVHIWNVPGARKPRFMHGTMHADRAAVMKEWAAGCVPSVPASPCRHMYAVEGCPTCP